MKKVTSALALAALVGTPAAAMANAEFGGDFDAGYYNLQGENSENGFEQRIRLQGSFESDGGVAVHTRLNLFNDRWTGDASGNTSDLDEQPYTTGARDHRNVSLDYGYVSMPLAGGELSIGRMISNWQFNLTASDDRRDRISYVRPLGGGHTGIVQYDRRAAGAPEDSTALDGNQVNLALLGPLADGVNYGILYAKFEAGGGGAGDAGYGLRGADLLAPYIEGEAGDLNYRVGGHYLGNGRGPIYTEDTFVVYGLGGFQMTPEFQVEGQVLYADGGALIAGGYDTFSSLIHNSLDHDQSATRIGALDLGGTGTEAEEDVNRTLIAARATYDMMDWTFMGALGYVDYDNDGAADNEVMFLDAQAHYRLTESTTVFGTAGYADLDEDIGDRDNFWATSVNVNVQF